MSTAMSKDTMLTALRDIQLPAATGGAAALDLLAAVVLAGLAALVLGLVLRGLTRRRDPVAEPSLTAQVQALQDRSEGEQISALLMLLKTHRPQRFSRMQNSLYRSDFRPDSAMLRQELLRD